MDVQEPQPPDLNTSSRDEDILRRSRRLIAIYSRLNSVRSHRDTPRLVAANWMISRLKSEISTTERGKNACPNIASYESQWNVLQRCRDLVRLNCYISCHPGNRSDCKVCPAGASKSESCPNLCHQAKDDSVWVDAVVEDGAEWLRVVGTDEKRLLHDMAAAGWDWESDGEGSDGDEQHGREEDDDEGEVPLIRLAKLLRHVAQARPNVCHIPRVRLVLTRIEEGKDSQIDRLLQKVRDLGVDIDCANSNFLTSAAPPLDTALENLLPEDVQKLTPTLNLDTTVLVALATDMCHAKLELQPWFSNTVRVHVAEENKSGGSLDKHIYPTLRGRRLVCTREAAEQFWKLVQEMGSKTEIKRAGILLPQRTAATETRDWLADLQRLSTPRVPPDLQLPIIVADEYFDMALELSKGSIPPLIKDAVEKADITPLNAAVFCYGWIHGYATITSNNEARKKMIRTLERGVLIHGEYTDTAGPQILALGCARSLVCKGPAPHRLQALLNGQE